MLIKKNVSKHQGLKFEAFKNGVTLRGLRSNVILKKDFRNNNKNKIYHQIFYKKRFKHSTYLYLLILVFRRNLLIFHLLCK